MPRKKPPLKITDSSVTTAGVTLDGKYSLAVNVIDGRPCLCVHRCTEKGGLHYSSMDETSLVTAISVSSCRLAVAAYERHQAIREYEEAHV